MAKLPKAEPRMPKLPKSLGACVDLYHSVREKRLAANKVTEEIKVTETFIANHIIDNVPKGDTGAIGAKYKGVVRTSDVFQVDDWEAFYGWIKKNGNFEVLNRALNQAAVEEHTEALNLKIDQANAKLAAGDPKRKPRKMLPGVKTFKAVKLSVTKV
jgi:hypothetical protein